MPPGPGVWPGRPHATDFSITIWYIRRMCRSLSGRWDAMSSQRAPSRARGALRSPSPEAPRRRARRRVAARGRGHWCRRRGGCPTGHGTCGPMKVLGGGRRLGRYRCFGGTPGNSPRLLLTSAQRPRRHSGEFPEVTPHERTRHAHFGQSTLHTSSPSPSPAPPPSSPPQCCPVRRGSARRHGEQPVMGCN